MARKTRTERLTLSMEEKLKRRFNTLCTWKGINMSDIAHELIEISKTITYVVISIHITLAYFVNI